MRPTLRGRTITPMSAPVRFVVELDDGPDPISGRLQVDERWSRFAGYVQLIAAIDALRRERAEKGPARSDEATAARRQPAQRSTR